MLIKLGIRAMTRCRSLIRDRPAMIPQFLLYQAQSDSNKVQGKRGETVCRRGASVGSRREEDQTSSLRSPPPDLPQVYLDSSLKKKTKTKNNSTSYLHPIEETGAPHGQSREQEIAGLHLCPQRLLTSDEVIFSRLNSRLATPLALTWTTEALPIFLCLFCCPCIF